VDARDTSTLLAEVGARTRDLFALLRSARELGKDAIAAIEQTAAEVEQRLTRSEHAILVVGESKDRCSLLDAILGERVLLSAQREAKRTTTLRSRPVLDYEAKLRGGIVERFRQSVPEREEAFAKAIARAARDRAAAEEEAQALSVELNAAQRRATTILIERKTYGDRLLALWAWLVAWFRGAFPAAMGSAALPAAPTLEARARVAAEKIAKASAHEATLEADRARYAVERRNSFFAALRALTDDLSRGGEVIELTIDVPSLDLPAGIVLVSAPELRVYDGIDGCLFVTDGARETRERFSAPLDVLGATASRSVAPGAPASDVWGAIEGLRLSAPLLAGERAVSLARRCIGSAVGEASRAEEVCQSRIAALERQRLADPADFRARSMARMEKAIDDGARDVLRAAADRVGPRVEAIKAEWRDALFACADRRAIEACVQSIRDLAPARIGILVEETNELVLSEVQRASDTMQSWLLEEIHARYQLARRSSAGDGSTPVIADGAAELVVLDGAPLEDAMDAFEHGRVGYGLGGAAAGAVLGTLVVPVIGTAIGAFLGVFAGLLKGIESLREDCVAKVEACVDESAQQILQQLAARHASLAAALRASLEEALEAAMQRFERSIARLMELETKTLAAENAKVARLAALRASLEAHEARFGALAVEARAQLGPPERAEHGR
jgi:hypothetical protein